MKTLEYHHLAEEKQKWGEGPWQDEPDKKQWTDPTTGLPCLIVRGPSGALCGYVGVPEGHPNFNRDYDEAPVEVHGGLTFADFCAPDEKEHGICHIVEDGENDRVWWLGFDCHHMMDIGPKHDMLLAEHGIDPIRISYPWGPETYKTFDYVTQEVTLLAEQLHQIGKVSLVKR